ncbi:MAG: 4Fe-4S binding protein [Candidatus Omnitrophica bacterium]|nr:4Fe-4S binding protein [Candidatus Omnitrophota bacterium]
MIIAVASGKGGTGKTTVAVNMALVAGSVRFLDCDVEEPNAHLFLKPAFQGEIPVSVPVPVVDTKKCTGCGKCAEVCVYHALAVIPSPDKKPQVLVFPHLCHACGACSLLCPEGAIREEQRSIGVIEEGVCGKVYFVHGKMNVGEVLSPTIIRRVKERIDPDALTIIDAPPGTSCPVVAAIKGVDFCVLVTEPTPFGLHDLTLAVDVVRQMKIPFGVVINRAGLGNDAAEDYCRTERIPVLVKIPFDREIAVRYSSGETLADKSLVMAKIFSKLYQNICQVKNEADRRS